MAFLYLHLKDIKLLVLTFKFIGIISGIIYGIVSVGNKQYLIQKILMLACIF